MGQEAREVLSINVELRCDRKCENCERFFDLTGGLEGSPKDNGYHLRMTI